jgi:serine/threonine protein phosphatase PrpC
MVQDADIWAIVQNASSLQQATRELIERARDNGGEDNITVVIIGFEIGNPSQLCEKP